MNECLEYFRQAVTDPLSVSPWSEWWAANEALAASVFPRGDYLRLKHRRLAGARHILQSRGELPEDYRPPDPLRVGSCSECGERTVHTVAGPGGGYVSCPRCGLVCIYDCRALGFWEGFGS